VKTCIFALALLAAFSANPAFPQTAANGGRSLPPGFIDGSKTPSLIPDSVALRLVFLSLVLPPEADQRALASQESHMKRIGLGDADRAVLKQIIAGFASDYANWQRPVRTQAGSGASAEDQAGLIVEMARESVTSQLSSDGSTRFIEYVTLAKSRMISHP